MEDATKIYQSEATIPDKHQLSSFDKKKHKKRRHFHEAKKHFEELSLIVDETHKELEEKNSPFRVCIYQEGEDIFIDIVTIDENGNTTQVYKHDISHTELNDIVHHIKSGRGLILDADV